MISNASMYNTHETATVEPEREYNEKRQDDDRKTKQKMELIRSKLKTHARKVNNYHHTIIKLPSHFLRMFFHFVLHQQQNNQKQI